MYQLKKEPGSTLENTKQHFYQVSALYMHQLKKRTGSTFKKKTYHFYQVTVKETMQAQNFKVLI